VWIWHNPYRKWEMGSNRQELFMVVMDFDDLGPMVTGVFL